MIRTRLTAALAAALAAGLPGVPVYTGRSEYTRQSTEPPAQPTKDDLSR